MSATDARQQYGARTRDFMIGLMCGAAFGTVAGLMMAAKPGKQLRGELADSAQRFRNQVTETYRHARGTMAQAVDIGREAFHKSRDSFGAGRVPAQAEMEAPLDATANRF
jgi:gas vesicle protein